MLKNDKLKFCVPIGTLRSIANLIKKINLIWLTLKTVKKLSSNSRKMNFLRRKNTKVQKSRCENVKSNNRIIQKM